MKRRLPVVALLGFALAFSACKEERSERVAASYNSAAQRTERLLPVPPPQKVTIGLDAIPTEEDYEARAAATITEANLLAKLAELELESRL